MVLGGGGVAGEGDFATSGKGITFSFQAGLMRNFNNESKNQQA